MNQVSPDGSDFNKECKLLAVIVRAQEQFIAENNRELAFDRLLSDILEVTRSEYGFIGEVLHDPEGQPYLKTYAITNIAWNAETEKFYQENAPKGLEFRNLNTLFGAALKTGQTVISNNPAIDPRSGGLPKGHPALNAFLGLPIYHGNEMVAMMGIANRPEGYDNEFVKCFSPLATTIGQLVTAARLKILNKQNEELISRLSRVASQTTNGVVMTNSSGLIEWINDGFIRLTGYAIEDLSGQQLAETLHGACNYAQTVAQIREAFNHQRVFESEVIAYKKNQQLCWVLMTCEPMYREDGSLQGFMAFYSDITEKKKSAHMLETSESRLRALFELSPIGIALNDFDTGAFIDVNDALLKSSGYTREEFLKLSYWEITPKEFEAMEREQLQSLARIGRYGPYEKEYIHKNGRRYPVNLNGVRVDDVNGRALIWSIVEDISERKRIAKLQNEFISTVSHELRTPLTAINGALGLIAGITSHHLPKEMQDILTIANKNCARLGVLVNDLLDMEKLLAGKIPFNMKTVDVVKVVDEAIVTNQTYAEQFNVEFVSTSFLQRPILIHVDELRMQQILANLLSNAAKFSLKNSKVEVSISAKPNSVVISIKDHGIGMPDDFKERIFQKFSQADASNTRQKSGTGLGLVISKDLIEKMGGSIGFETELGVGSTFYIEIPIAE